MAEGLKVAVPKGAELCALKKAGEAAEDVIKNTKSAGGIKWAAEYYKHRPPKNIPWKDILKSTIHGPAKYKPGLNIRELELNAWNCGQKTTNGKNWKVFKSNEIIGANSGKETYCLRVECSANTIHGHPILESQYLELIK